MTLTKAQEKRYLAFCKKHDILGFGGTAFKGAPCISLDLFAKNPKKKTNRKPKEVWITQRSITGHNVGVHRSVEGDVEVVAGWCGMGWCMFGRQFVEQLTNEFRELFPEFNDTNWTKGYDAFEYRVNYIRVFATEAEKLSTEIELAQAGTEV